MQILLSVPVAAAYPGLQISRASEGRIKPSLVKSIPTPPTPPPPASTGNLMHRRLDGTFYAK